MLKSQSFKKPQLTGSNPAAPGPNTGSIWGGAAVGGRLSAPQKCQLAELLPDRPGQL